MDTRRGFLQAVVSIPFIGPLFALEQPNEVSFTVSNLTSGDRVLIIPSTFEIYKKYKWVEVV
jgi:hypothetical protein